MSKELDRKLLGSKLAVIKEKTSTSSPSSKELDSFVKKVHDEKPVCMRTTIDIPKQLHKYIKRRSIDTGETIKEYILKLVVEDLKKNGDKTA